MTILLLIRHAENDYVKTGRLAGRLAGIHLNETGRQQARAVADKLTGAPVKAVYSSPLERAIETATPIAEALNLEVTLRPNLVEMDFGEWQNKKLKGLSRFKARLLGCASRRENPSPKRSIASARSWIYSPGSTIRKI